ncbi:hypothetical protein ZHAS_00014816 [Anopheles sinensis]|uniref:Uncharacterized protein n=1 Tax=Anopheles sinensis TaxID=74873 RepID=A0A084W954_ANOSI|nr:hypothetical protein ZHAS_00014816 [Anopheles sinensis]
MSTMGWQHKWTVSRRNLREHLNNSNLPGEDEPQLKIFSRAFEVGQGSHSSGGFQGVEGRCSPLHYGQASGVSTVCDFVG